MNRVFQTIALIIILILSNLSLNAIGNEIKPIIILDDLGSLSGCVFDSSMNPIQGAVINITCGSLFFQDLSNASGRYHISNIPIVDCYWNVSVSKKNFRPIWIDISIDENTSYDFVLTLKSKIVYVDDDGNADYTKIQDAVDNVNNGDIVKILPGTYNENIVMSKQIQLEGIDKEKTIISAMNPSENLIIDSCSFSTICNLTFSSNHTERLDIIRMINCSYCKINNIDIASDSLQRSAIIVNGSHNTITQIVIYGKFIFSGIELFYTNENAITNNSIDTIGAGILIHRSHNNIIISNNITNSTNGIYIEEGNNNIISKNSLIKNNRGLFSSYSIKNSIINNDFIENDEDAKFTRLLRRGFILPNNWNNNYWDNHKNMVVKTIPGIFYIPNGLLFGLFVPWVAFDWNPATQPFNNQLIN